MTETIKCLSCGEIFEHVDLKIAREMAFAHAIVMKHSIEKKEEDMIGRLEDVDVYSLDDYLLHKKKDYDTDA